MAGHVAAMRALRAGQNPLGFDPFGEHDERESQESDDDVEPAGELNSEDEARALAGVKGTPGNVLAPAKTAAQPASTKPGLPGLKSLNTVWTMPCSAVYEDEDAEVFCVRWSPDDTLLAAGCGDGVVRVFNAEGGKLSYVLEREAWRPRLPTTCLRFRPPTEVSKTKNVLLVGNADGTVQHWHITSRKCMHTITEQNNQARRAAPDRECAPAWRGGCEAVVKPCQCQRVAVLKYLFMATTRVAGVERSERRCAGVRVGLQSGWHGLRISWQGLYGELASCKAC